MVFILGLKHLGGSLLWLASYLSVSHGPWQRSWMGSSRKVICFGNFLWALVEWSPSPGNVTTLTLMRQKIWGRNSTDKHCGVPQLAEYIGTENQPMCQTYFEASALVSTQGTIAFSFCNNESHPFPIKVTLTKYISGWLRKKKERNMFLKTINQAFGNWLT